MNKGAVAYVLWIGGILAAAGGLYAAYERWDQQLYLGMSASFPGILLTHPLFVGGVAAFVAGVFVWKSAVAELRDYGECPYCRERIRVGAEKCRFCGEKVKWVEE